MSNINKKLFFMNSGKNYYCILTIIIIFVLFCPTIVYSNSIDESVPNLNIKFAWPCKPKCKIVRDFDKNLSKYSAGNRGIDLSVKENEKIYAPYDGKIFFIGKIAGKNVVSIMHKENIKTTYVGVKSFLKKNDLITKNSLIGVTDYTNMDNKTLQFGVILNETSYLDPKLFLFDEIILLPTVKW